MKNRLEIELFEEHPNVNIYTILFKNETTEIEKFLNKFPAGCEFDRKDNIYALPIENSNLRLYVIRLSDDILILGNGGIKKTKAYNKVPELNNIVEQLQSIDCLIRNKKKQGSIQIKGKQLLGKLEFEI